jgi:hypothetical protein
VITHAASAPNIISYQGRLLNNNGVPVASSSANVIFEIYTAASGGSCLWSNSSTTCASATARTVTLTDGLFSENLGDTAAGVPYAAITDSVFGNNAATYLQVTVNGEALTPRKQVVAAPYALNSDTLDGMDADTDGSTATAVVAFDANGNLQITGNPQGGTVADGSLYINPATAQVSGGDTIFGVAVNGTEKLRLREDGYLYVADTVLVGNQIDSSTAGTLSIANLNASQLDVCVLGAGVCDTLNVGTGGDADTIAIGDALDSLALTSAAWSLSNAGVMTFSATGAQTTAIVITDTDYTNALSIGDNTILGTTANIDLTNFDVVGSTGNITTGGDLAVNGGDFTSSNSTFNFLDAASNPGLIDIGGNTADILNTVNIATNSTSGDGVNIGNLGSTTVVINGGQYIHEQGAIIDLNNATGSLTTNIGAVNADGASTVNIATQGTTADTVTIGNSNAATSVAITSKDGFSGYTITGNGVATFGGTTTINAATYMNSDVHMEGGFLESVAATFYFLDSIGDSPEINIGGVTTNKANTVNIATNSTASDTINIGNSATTTATNITGTVDFNIPTNRSLTVHNGATNYIFVDTSSGSELLEIGNTTSGVQLIGNTSVNGGVTVTPSAGNDGLAVHQLNSGDDGLYIVQETVADATTGPTGQALVIDVNESQDNDETILIRSDADGTPDTEFRFENDGDAFADGAFTGAGADLAEFFPSGDTSLTDSLLACTDQTAPRGVKRCEPNNTDVVGVISTNPAFIGNLYAGAETDSRNDPHYRLVGLVGQIDTFASADDGAIAIGDPVTTSSTTGGYAGLARGAGKIVGYALEPLAAGRGKIRILISPQWYGGEMLAADGSATGVAGDLHLTALADATVNSPTSNSHALILTGSAFDGAEATDVNMGLRTRVSSLSNYRLAFENTMGGEVASITNAGDLVVSGKLFPSDRGVTQTSAYIFYDSSAGGGYVKTNAAGWNVGSYDFAEMFPSDEALAPGEVVSFASKNEAVAKSSGKPYDDKLVGVVSTRPGFLAGEYKTGSYPIALSGRVPTKVNDENGTIAIGDPLTTSSTPGVAMKATKNGPILGYAMEPLASGEGKVIAFIRASYYDGGDTAPQADNAVSGLATAGSLDLSGTLNMGGGNILSIGSLEGIGGAWKIAENGDFATEGVIVEKVRSFMGDLVPTYVDTSVDRTIQLSGTSTLENGVATVSFDAIAGHYNDIISTTSSYRVLVTPTGATGQVYVTDRSNSGFTIHDTGNSSGILVDWLVIAYHKDYEPTVASPTPTPEPEIVPEVVVEPTPEPTPEPEPVVEPIIEPVIEPEVAGETVTEEPPIETTPDSSL